MIPKKLALGLDPWVGTGFPCAKPWQPFALSFDAAAGEGRSEKIMLKQQAKAKGLLNLKPFRFKPPAARPPLSRHKVRRHQISRDSRAKNYPGSRVCGPGLKLKPRSQLRS